MESRRTANFALFVEEDFLSSRENSTEYIRAYFGNKTNLFGRIALTLAQYLLQHSQTFESVSYLTRKSRNDTFTDTILDVHPQLCLMEERLTQQVDFAYPYKLYDYSFLTRKPRYEPQIFGLFHAFSPSVWTAVLLALTLMPLICYVVRQASFRDVTFHVLALFLGQNPILKPSSVAEKLLLWSWVAAAMFLSLAYNSVFLSFLTLPPINQIKNVGQLASAVRNGQYACVNLPDSPIAYLLLKSNLEDLRVIGRDIAKNVPRRDHMLRDFFLGSGVQNVALVSETEIIDIWWTREMSTSEDRFQEVLPAMTVRKGFCCKEQIDAFVHRLMASGLFFKYASDENFLFRLPRVFKDAALSDDAKRKLTLTDVAPAFLFLLAGYFLSTVVLIGELLQNRRKRQRRN